MINKIVVRIVAERIMNGGINPKTNEIYKLDDITNVDYRQAVEDYILINTEGI